MSTTATIAGASVAIQNPTFGTEDRVEERTRCSFAVIDLAGTTTFSKGQPVTITDSVLGTMFTGYVNQPKATVLYPNPGRLWAIDCIDETWLADKRTSQKSYKNQFAGTIAVDQVQRYGAAEGLTCKAALRWDELLTDWAAGTLTGVSATTNATDGNVGDGDLELTSAGTIYTSSLTSATVPTTPALAFTGTASGVVPNPTASWQIWSGSIAANANDTFSFSVWISSTSPQISAGLDLYYSDGSSYLGAFSLDQEDVFTDPATDLSGLANDQWYTRTFNGLGSTGKTITSCRLILGGGKAGTYNAYFKNVVYVNHNTSTTTNIFTTTQNSNVPLAPFGYSAVSQSLVNAASAPTQKVVFTPSGSISGVGLVKSSLVSWTPTVPSGTTLVLESSIDGEATWQSLTSGAAIPNLLPGTQVSQIHLAFRATYTVTTNPAVPTLGYADFGSSILPSSAMTKTDLGQAYGNAVLGSPIAFSSGTLTNTQVVSSALALSGVSRNYTTITSPGPTVPLADQTNYIGLGTAYIVSGQFFVNCNNAANTEAKSRLDFAGQWQNFTAEVDVQVPDAAIGVAGLVYRTTGWQALLNTFGYSATISSTQLVLGRGTNTSSGGGAFTVIGAPVTLALTGGSTHRLKIVVNGNSHIISLDGLQLISATDSTYPATGYLGMRVYQASATGSTALFNNFSVRSALSGTWQSAALAISSPTTYGTSVVAWDIDGIPDSSSSITMQSSVDGGSTFQSVTNGSAIPNLTAGQSLSAKTLILKATLSCATGPSAPVLNGVSVLILQQYSSSGTRVAPSLSLSPVGRAGTALVNWNANLPTGTALTVATSINGGSTYQTVASAGNPITGIATQPTPVVDSFTTNTSANYTQSNFASGVTGTWTWDTAHSRLTGSGGTNGTIVHNPVLTSADSQVMADFDECDGSGILANYVDANNLYFVQVWDGSGTGTQNSVKLFKRSGGVTAQLGSTATLATWTRGNYRRIILDVQAGVLTVSMDGVQLIQQTDGSPLAAGKAGLLLNTLARCYTLRIQQYGQNVSALSLLTKLTLTSTDPTVTPQVLDLQAFVSSTDIGPGKLIPAANYIRTYVSANLADLNTQSGTTWWYVRPDKSVVFQDRTATPAPWILDSANVTPFAGQQQGDVLLQNLELDTSGDLYRNRQVLTGVIGSTNFNETKAGDGSTRTWNVANALTAPPTVWTLNGQPVTYGIQGVDTGRQFYYQIGSTSLTQDGSGTLLAKTDTLAISYPGAFVTEVVRDNATPGTFPNTISQAEMAAIDGTTGIVENVLDVSKLNMTVAAAQTYGDQLLQRYGLPNGRMLTFMTLRPGLAPGQALTGFVLAQQCNNVQFLVAAVSISTDMASVPGGILYWYSVEAVEGSTLGSPWRQLTSMISGSGG